MGEEDSVVSFPRTGEYDLGLQGIFNETTQEGMSLKEHTVRNIRKSLEVALIRY